MAKTATKWLPLFRSYLRHLRIQSKHAAEDIDGEGIELKLWTSQTRVLEQICDGLENGIHVFLILKSRQLGVTTITLAILLFWLANNPNTIGILVSNNEDNNNKNKATIAKYLNSLAPFMGKSFSANNNNKGNKYGFTFSNGSRLDLRVAGNKAAWGEGEGYLVGHLTEVARYVKPEGIEGFRHAMAPDNPRALYIFEGTAAGQNHWKDMWDAGREDTFSTRCIFVGWWSNDLQRIKRSHPRFAAFGTAPPTPEEHEKIMEVRELYNYDITMEQLAWYRMEQTRPSSSEDDMAQNQPWTEKDCFLESGVSFFGPKLVKKRYDEIDQAPPALVEDGGYSYLGYNFYLGDEYHLSKVHRLDPDVDDASMVRLKVWEKPVPEGVYIIGVDPAGGRSEESNNHACCVVRAFADKLVQVAEWADNIPDTRHCAWVTAYLAGQYQNCRINIDLTGGIGTAVMQAFEDLRNRMRSELYQSKVGEFEDFLTAANWHLYRRIDSPGPGYMYCTKLGRDLKWKMMNVYRDSWVTNALEIRSLALLGEMSNIVQARGDIGASAPGRQRDDRAFALALCNWTWVENVRPMMIAQGITWENSKKKEGGVISPIADQLNRRVWSIMRAADEADEAPAPQTFYQSRGLA